MNELKERDRSPLPLGEAVPALFAGTGEGAHAGLQHSELTHYQILGSIPDKFCVYYGHGLWQPNHKSNS